MPIFLDHHKGVSTPEQRAQVVKAIKAGMKSPQGVKGINGFFSDTESWCMTEAPNAKAIHDYHESMGIKLPAGDVSEIKTLV